MDAIPDEWVDKIFHCMEMFYVEHWTVKLKNKEIEILNKTLWKNGLNGLTYKQIKNALIFYKKMAKYPRAIPPDIVSFYHIAVKIPYPKLAFKAKLK